MKNNNKLKVVSINDKLIGEMNKEIVNALALSKFDKDDSHRFNDLIPQSILRIQNDEDIEYIKNNGSNIDMNDYVLDRRVMLSTAYYNFVDQEIMFLTHCIETYIITAFNKFAGRNIDNMFYINRDNIRNIISSVFNRDLREFMFNDKATENIVDIRIINNNIPEVCLKLEMELRDALLNKNNIRVIEPLIELEDDFGKYKGHDNFNHETYFTNYEKIEVMIDDVVKITNIALVSAYCKIKDYVNMLLCPLGYPSINLRQDDVTITHF